MSPPVKIAGFLAVLAALFGLSLAVGNAVGPVSDADQAPGPARPTEPDAVAPEQIPTGLMIAQNGGALVLADFQHDGVVRTAAFALGAGETTVTTGSQEKGDAHNH